MFMRKQAGYTVNELIAALAVSGIVASSASPMTSIMLNQYRLTAATRQLAFEITRSRMEAVGQNAYVRITLVNGVQFRRERSTDGLTYVEDGPLVTLPTGFRLVAGGTGAPRFDRQGMGASSTTLIVYGPRGQQTLSTNILGRVTIS